MERLKANLWNDIALLDDVINTISNQNNISTKILVTMANEKGLVDLKKVSNIFLLIK